MSSLRPDRAERRREPGGQAAQGGRNLRGPACAQVPSPRVLRPGREVRLALLGRPSPPRVLGLPLPAAVPSWRAYLCRSSLLTSPPPHAGGKGAEPPPGNGEGASSPGARPPSSSSRCWCCGAAQGESGPGRRLLFSPSAPAPFLARPGAEPRPRRTYLLAPRGAVRRRLGPPGRLRGGRHGEGAGAGDRRAPRLELRPRPARAPGVSSGRHWEAGFSRGAEMKTTEEPTSSLRQTLEWLRKELAEMQDQDQRLLLTLRHLHSVLEELRAESVPWEDASWTEQGPESGTSLEARLLAAEIAGKSSPLWRTRNNLVWRRTIKRQ
ncbi:hypothetical protein R6Z07F_012419 [Ovis aries]